MNITKISVEAYQHIAYDDGFNAIETVMLAGKWPVTVGTHPDFPGGPILVGHIHDRAFMVTLDDIPDLDTDFVERMLNINPNALQ